MAKHSIHRSWNPEIQMSGVPQAAIAATPNVAVIAGSAPLMRRARL